MRLRPPTIVGAALGLAAALLLIGYLPRTQSMPPSHMLPDHGGAMRSVVLQYSAGATFTHSIYRAFLAQQSSDLVAYLACPSQADFEEIRTAIGQVPCKILPVLTGHTMSAWSRDRWVALTPENPGPVTLLAPKGELMQDSWPQRAGDSHIAEDLARAFPKAMAAQRSGLYFDGGDFLADGDYVFATRALLDRNLQHTVADRSQLLAAIARDLHRTVLLMDDSPNHHAGMFMMAAGRDPLEPSRRIMLVGDPSLAEPLFNRDTPSTALFTGGPDFSPQAQARFDSVARLASTHGYRVIRIPVVPAAAGKMWMTYLNGILDVRDGHPVVCMATYRAQERLNVAAADIWKSLGYEIRPIDCSDVWPLGGTLHCLINVLNRDDK